MLLFNLRKPLFVISQFVNNHFEAKEITFYMRCLNYVFIPLIILLFIAALLRNTLLGYTAILNIIILITLLVIILMGVYMIVRLFISTKSFPYHELNKTQQENPSTQIIISDSNSEESLDSSLPEAPLKNIFTSGKPKCYIPFIRLISKIFFKETSAYPPKKWLSAFSQILGANEGSMRTTLIIGRHPEDQNIIKFIMNSVYKNNSEKRIENYPQYCEYFDRVYSILHSKGYYLEIELYNEFKLLCVLYFYWIKEAKNKKDYPKIPDELNDKSLKKSLWDKLVKKSL